VRLTALQVFRLAARVIEGRPHPGQRYTHGWIPVATADLIAKWNGDLADKQHLVDAVDSGARRAGPYRYSSRDTTRVDLADFGNGSEGVVTTYLGGDPERDADADQLGSTLARSLGIRGPRKLRVTQDRTVSDLVDGSTWTEREEQILNDPRAYELLRELDSPTFGKDAYNYGPAVKATAKMQGEDIAAQRDKMLSSRAGLRAGVLDLLMGVDERDGGTLVLGPDGVTPVQSETAWRYADGRNRPNEVDRASKANGAIAPAQRKLAAPDLVTWLAFSSLRSWKDNPLTRADVVWLRERLDEVRTQFMRLGRRRWWQFAWDRLDAMAAHRAGTVDLFASQG